MNKTKTPALFDRHIHGGYGVDFNNCSSDDVEKLCSILPKHGLGAICPTVMTDDKEQITNQIDIISKARKKLKKGDTQIFGIHLEGPFINPQKKGIHPEDKILKPTVKNFQKIVPPSLESEIKIVTLAAELDENLELTKYLKSKNITVSAGHTISKGDELDEIKEVTHFFNAMPALHHRNLNITSKSLMDNNIFLEVIADNFHIAPEMLNMILKVKSKEKIIFISDALSAAYSNQEKIIFAGEEIYIKENTARDKEGTIAGATKYLDEIIRLNTKTGLISFDDGIQFCSQNVYKSLGADMPETYIEWDEDCFVTSAHINSLNL